MIAIPRGWIKLLVLVIHLTPGTRKKSASNSNKKTSNTRIRFHFMPVLISESGVCVSPFDLSLRGLSTGLGAPQCTQNFSA